MANNGYRQYAGNPQWLFDPTSGALAHYNRIKQKEVLMLDAATTSAPLLNRVQITTNNTTGKAAVGDRIDVVAPPGVLLSNIQGMQDKTATGGSATTTITGFTTSPYFLTSTEVPPLGVKWPITAFASTSNAFSDALDISNPATMPAAPTIGTATAGNATITAPYTDGSDGGAAISRHDAQLFDASGALISTTTGVANPAVLTATNGVVNNSGQKVKIRAVNSVNPGPYSAFSNTVTPSTVPTGPVMQQSTTHKNVFAGNSLVFGQGTTGSNGNFPLQMQRGNVINNAAIQNSGVSGQTITAMRAGRAAQVDAYFDATKVCILHVWELTNQICTINATTTGQQAWDVLKLYLTEILAVHPEWKFVLYTSIPRYGLLFSGLSVATANAELLNANALMLAEGPSLPGVAAVVDLRQNTAFVYSGGSGMSAANTAVYNADSVHLQEEGYALVAASGNTAMRAANALRITPTLVPETPVLASYVEKSGAIRIKIAQPTGGGLAESYVVTDSLGTVITDSAVGTNGWDRIISGLSNGVARQLIITPVNSVGPGPALTTAALTPKALTTQLYNFEADTVGAAPANVTAINGILLVTNTGFNNATKSVNMPAAPVDTKAGVFQMDNLAAQAADQVLTFKRTCNVTTGEPQLYIGIRLQAGFSTATGFENFRAGYYLRVRAVGTIAYLMRLDANGSGLIQLGSFYTYSQTSITAYELSAVEDIITVKLGGVVRLQKQDCTYTDGRNVPRLSFDGAASLQYIDDMQLVS